MSIWVCPHCPNKKSENEIEKIEGLARLYAYPCEPKFKNGGLVILDSGAFGLYQAGKHMDLQYLKNLSEHYKKHYKANVICVAPDVGANPMQSMLNFRKWQKLGLFPNISPVLQSDDLHSFNLKTMLKQAEFYRKYSDVILVGSPKLSAELAVNLKIWKLFKELKKLGFKWIHKLGVGWNIAEIKIWKDIEYLDSFDSISYYTTKNVSEFGSLNAYENTKKILELWSNED